MRRERTGKCLYVSHAFLTVDWTVRIRVDFDLSVIRRRSKVDSMIFVYWKETSKFWSQKKRKNTKKTTTKETNFTGGSHQDFTTDLKIHVLPTYTECMFCTTIYTTSVCIQYNDNLYSSYNYLVTTYICIIYSMEICFCVYFVRTHN